MGVSPKKILIIEDDKVVGENLKSCLGELGFAVHLITDGERGLKDALGGSYDLLLLDLWLPKVNGFHILERLREHSSALPVIVLSNSCPELEIQKAERAGVKDYLIKVNFTPQEVYEKIKNYFESVEKPAAGEKRVLVVEDEDLLLGAGFCVLPP